MLDVGGSEPLATTPVRFFHFRLAKNSNAPTRKSRAKVAPALTPAMPPFDRPEELLLPAGITGIVFDAELASGRVAVVSTLEVVVESDEAADVVEELKLVDELDVAEETELVEGLGLVEERELADELELVDELELAVELVLVDEVVLDEILGIDVGVGVNVVFLKTAALSELLESFAPTKSSSGHPSSQASEEQQPKKGRSKSKHVYHFPFGLRHSWSLMPAPLLFLKLEYVTLLAGQILYSQSQSWTYPRKNI